jgi:hypothetical protein
LPPRVASEPPNPVMFPPGRSSRGTLPRGLPVLAAGHCGCAQRSRGSHNARGGKWRLLRFATFCDGQLADEGARHPRDRPAGALSPSCRARADEPPMFPSPSPPCEKAAAREDETGQSCADDRAWNDAWSRAERTA